MLAPSHARGAGKPDAAPLLALSVAPDGGFTGRGDGRRPGVVPVREKPQRSPWPATPITALAGAFNCRFQVESSSKMTAASAFGPPTQKHQKRERAALALQALRAQKPNRQAPRCAPGGSLEPMRNH
jgi:hypothetical protein